MKKTSIILIGLLFLGIFAVSGCIQSTAEEKAERYSFVGGLKGLDMSFMANQPPARVYEGQQFTIAIDIENKGEADISEGRLIIEGVDPASFGIDEPTQTIAALPGIKKAGDSTIPGGKTIMTYIGTGKTVEATTQPMPLRITAIYPYKTTGVALICLKENIYTQTAGGSEICTLTGEKIVESSGAPLQVTYVEELPTGFNIKIENKGPGTPFIDADDTPTIAEKPGDLGFGELNKVRISAKIGDGAVAVTCSQPTLTLTNDVAETFCAANLGQAPAEFTDILTIALNYGYMQSINKNIIVENVLNLTA